MNLLWFKHASEEKIGHWAASGSLFLVSQTYHNGYHFYPKHQKLIVLSAYPALMHADNHWRKVQHDPYAAIIHLNKEKHRLALQKRFVSNEHQLFIAEMNDPVQLQLLCYHFRERLMDWLSIKAGEKMTGDEHWPPDLIVRHGLVYIRFVCKKQEHIIPYDQLHKWYEESGTEI